jgi:hypothetical protein
MNTYKEVLKQGRKDIFYQELMDTARRIDHSKVVKTPTKVNIRKQKTVKNFY